ncbi:MAG: NAD-dependent epimerase/dehydratase family protein [Paraglaciecola sp.]|uniref:NAD-dependent epimerase/dehydratase family protein n=1 Tax=Paraglaciecola sp. TaxID=1920173 RepID=UPI003298D6E6
MQIAIVGCGWLGQPLGLSLQKSGHNIVATNRSETGCAKLNTLGFKGLQFNLGDKLSTNNLEAIFNSDLLILNIPVGRKSNANGTFLANINDLLKRLVTSTVKRVVFVSTTSVYGAQKGELSEHSATSPNTQSGQINLQIEQLVQEYFSSNATTMRLSGLVGEDRHPVIYLAGKTALAAPNTRVNLVHQVDVIQSIESIIRNEIWGQTLLLSAAEHPTRQNYYTWAAKRLKLAIPQFIDELEASDGKIINAAASIRLLDITLQYPSPYDML